MRDYIIKRIETLKAVNDQFSRSIMRWREEHVLVPDKEQGVNLVRQHISEVDFNFMTDSQLGVSFERIIRLTNKQM